jgi:eukaryotic-like serine/threonine-protein kinase
MGSFEPTPTIPDEGDPGDLPERGTSIGRFLILGPLGLGGMGFVLSAYDPDLDRKVAVKLLRGDVWRGERASAGREALMREAQTMARLNHPNVVTV